MDFEFSPEVPSIDGVPEDFRGLYAREGDSGPFKLRQDEHSRSAVKAILGLNVALKAARTERDGFKGKVVDLGPLMDFGATPQAILEAFNGKLKEVTKGQTGKPTSEQLQEAVNAAKGDLQKAHVAELGVRDKRIEALVGQLHSTLVTQEITSALAVASAVNPALMAPFIEKQVQVKEEDGKFVVQVVDPQGNPRFSTVTGKPLSIKELVSELKGKDKWSAYRPP